jgi:multimeric flavodoxin WrbA
MKKIVAFLGSPRKQGNTAIVLERVLAGARDAGAEVESVFLHGMDLHPCRECLVCQSVPDEPGCAIKDDMAGIYAKVFESNVIVLASPVFCWSVSAQMKILLDRAFCFFKFEESESPRILVKNKAIATVLTAGGDEFDGADLAVETIRRLARYVDGDYRGHFVAANLSAPDDVRKDKALLDRAYQFGKCLV